MLLVSVLRRGGARRARGELCALEGQDDDGDSDSDDCCRALVSTCAKACCQALLNMHVHVSPGVFNVCAQRLKNTYVKVCLPTFELFLTARMHAVRFAVCG